MFTIKWRGKILECVTLVEAQDIAALIYSEYGARVHIKATGD